MMTSDRTINISRTNKIIINIMRRGAEFKLQKTETEADITPEILLMFELPNNPKLDNNDFRSRAQALNKQYEAAIQYEADLINLKGYVDNLSLTCESKLTKEILARYPQEAIRLIDNIKYFDIELQLQIAIAAFDINPKKAAEIIMRQLGNIPEEAREKLIRLAFKQVPQEISPLIVTNIFILPEKLQIEFFTLAIQNNPRQSIEQLISDLRYLEQSKIDTLIRLAFEINYQEALSIFTTRIKYIFDKIIKEFSFNLILSIIKPKDTPLLIENLDCLPEEKRVDFVNRALEINPEQVAYRLIEYIYILPQETRVDFVNRALEINPEQSAPVLVRNINHLPEEKRVDFVNRALELTPAEKIHELFNYSYLIPEDIKENFAQKLIEKSPLKGFSEFIIHIDNFSQYTILKLVDLRFKENDTEVALTLFRYIKYLPEEKRVDFVNRALEINPEQVAYRLIEYIYILPQETRVDFVNRALEINPEQSAPVLVRNIKYLPEEKRVDFVNRALEINPEQSAPAIIINIKHLPEEKRVDFVNRALSISPQEVANVLRYQIKLLPKDKQSPVEKRVIEIIQEEERNIIIESEKTNPVLYKKSEDLGKPFSKKEFEKTDTKTFLLGGPLKNKAILRIIPNTAFISWFKAYKAVEVWKKAGFNYVPIEPILKSVRSNKDTGKIRVYAGVLGISVDHYLRMYSNKKHHDVIIKQVNSIKYELEQMGIEHGHTHYNNFCVLHERTSEGEIDWEKPPRVYCIDFDQAISNY